MLCLTVIIDIWKHIIPNCLLVILLIINLLSAATLIVDSRVTFEGMLLRTGCMVLIFVFLFPFFSIGAIGGGDVKLILVSAMVVEAPLVYFATVFVVAAILAIIKMIASGNGVARIKHLALYVKTTILTKSINPYLDEELKGNGKIKFSVHLSIPVLVASIMCLTATMNPNSWR